MSTYATNHRLPAPSYRPRLNAYQLGAAAARTTGSLKGMPFGVGKGQDDYIQGFQDETLGMVRDNGETVQ